VFDLVLVTKFSKYLMTRSFPVKFPLCDLVQSHK
jgi:hypothetical protein